MKTNESSEMYLESILLLKEEQEKIRSIDIAHFTGYSRASVSRAISLLKNEDMIIVDDLGYISLTKKGEELASKILERHRVLTELFVSIGVSEKTAALDACKVEHVISDETFNKIKENIKK